MRYKYFDPSLSAGKCIVFLYLFHGESSCYPVPVRSLKGKSSIIFLPLSIRDTRMWEKQRHLIDSQVTCCRCITLKEKKKDQNCDSNKISIVNENSSKTNSTAKTGEKRRNTKKNHTQNS